MRRARDRPDAPIGADEFDRAFLALADLPGPWLAAVSGGPDSTALMHAAAAWASAGGSRPRLHVATVDHGFRPASRGEAEAVGRAAAALGLPHAILAWTGRPAGTPSQAAARHARYGLLAAHARRLGARRIATAHTRDDQAETVLMRLAAGSGLSGLAGMRAETALGDLVQVRPVLPVAKASLVATCRARGWAYVEDPSNADPRYARSRWRDLMPALAAEGLGPDRLWRFAGRMQRADLALDAVTEAAAGRLVVHASDGSVAVDLVALLTEPDEIALRVFLGALAAGTPSGRAGEPRIRLERAEAALAALRAARLCGLAARRTVAGSLLTLDREGRLSIRPEPSRSRGRERPSSAATSPQSRPTFLDAGPDDASPGGAT